MTTNFLISPGDAARLRLSFPLWYGPSMDFWCDDAATCVSEAVREDWDAFLLDAPAGALFEVVYDGDADGLCAAAVACAGFAALNYQAVCRRAPAAGERLPPQVYGRVHLSRAEPSQVAQPLFCLICDEDHDTDPVRAFVLWALFDERCDLQPHAWLAAIALLERHGNQSGMPFLKAAKARHTAKGLKQVLTWLQLAPHAHCDLTQHAFEALCVHRDVRALVRSEHASVSMLRQAQVAILQAQRQADNATPHLSGRIALIRMRSACQVQALVARHWSRRLPGYLVMVANEGAGGVGIATCSALALDTHHFIDSLALPPDFDTDGAVSLDTWAAALRVFGAHSDAASTRTMH